MSIIEDGSGAGFSAAVTVNNRLMTTGVDLTLEEAATESGDTYNVSTNEIRNFLDMSARYYFIFFPACCSPL